MREHQICIQHTLHILGILVLLRLRLELRLRAQQQRVFLLERAQQLDLRQVFGFLLPCCFTLVGD